MTHQDKQQGDEQQSGGKNTHRVATPTNGQDSKVVDAAQLKTAQERAKEVLDTAEKQASVLMDQAVERLAPLDSWVRLTTQEHPYLALSSAAGVSFLAGFLMRRRSAVGAGMALGFFAGCLISGSGARAAARQTRKL